LDYPPDVIGSPLATMAAQFLDNTANQAPRNGQPGILGQIEVSKRIALQRWLQQIAAQDTKLAALALQECT
jgi:hypothetical protein